MDADGFGEHIRAWPGVDEDVKWGADRVWSVAGKMFCALPLDGKGGPGFKVAHEDFLAMTDRPGIRPAPYLARARWVVLDALDSLPEAELLARVRASYELIRAKLPKRLQRELAD